MQASLILETEAASPVVLCFAARATCCGCTEKKEILLVLKEEGQLRVGVFGEAKTRGNYSRDFLSAVCRFLIDKPQDSTNHLK